MAERDKRKESILPNVVRHVAHYTEDTTLLKWVRTVFALPNPALQQFVSDHFRQSKRFLAYKLVSETEFAKLQDRREVKIDVLETPLRDGTLSANHQQHANWFIFRESREHHERLKSDDENTVEIVKYQVDDALPKERRSWSTAQSLQE